MLTPASRQGPMVSRRQVVTATEFGITGIALCGLGFRGVHPVAQTIQIGGKEVVSAACVVGLQPEPVPVGERRSEGSRRLVLSDAICTPKVQGFTISVHGGSHAFHVAP